MTTVTFKIVTPERYALMSDEAQSYCATSNEALIEKIRHFIFTHAGQEKKSRKDTFYHQVIKVEEISPDFVIHYQKLQEAIAKEVPEEYRRPNIVLDIRGKNRKLQGSVADFGYIGGVGPLSDAEILSKVIKNLDEKERDNFHAVLFSFPPPRKDEHGTLYQHSKRYGLKFPRELRKYQAKQFAVFSNTAHLNLNKMEMVLKTSCKNHELMNLVSEVCDFAQKDNTPNKRILVVGTTPAAEQGLYPKMLQKRGIDSLTPKSNQPAYTQAVLQRLIDLIKSGKTNHRFENTQSTVGETLVNFIAHHVQGSPITHILLGCTELPFALHTKIEPTFVRVVSNHHKIYLDMLREKIGPRLLIDTEEIMSKNLANRQKRLVQIAEARNDIKAMNEALEQKSLKIFSSRDLEKLTQKYPFEVILSASKQNFDSKSQQEFQKYYLDYLLANLAKVTALQMKLTSDPAKKTSNFEEHIKKEVLSTLKQIILAFDWGVTRGGETITSPFTHQPCKIPDNLYKILREIEKAEAGSITWDASANNCARILREASQSYFALGRSPLTQTFYDCFQKDGALNQTFTQRKDNFINSLDKVKKGYVKEYFENLSPLEVIKVQQYFGISQDQWESQKSSWIAKDSGVTKDKGWSSFFCCSRSPKKSSRQMYQGTFQEAVTVRKGHGVVPAHMPAV